MTRKLYTARAWTSVLALGTILTAAGCGGGSSSTPSTVTLGVSPSSISLTLDQTQTFSAVVFNAANTTVTWSVAPGGAGGTINPSSGLYTAPAALSRSTADKIVATSAADPTRSATATVNVTVGSAPVTVNIRQGGHK